jgi:hypothetical protein
MAITRSFTDAYTLTDYTEELLIIPNQWGLVNSLGIFSEEGVSVHNVTVESRNESISVIADQIRGARNNVNKDYTRTLRSFPIPHFPLDDSISPNDIQGKRAYGTPDSGEVEAAVMGRKLERIRKNHAITMEAARVWAITRGQIYAPNGTVAGNYYTDFGYTRTEYAFGLDSASTDVVQQGEVALSTIQDAVMTGDVIEKVVALCSPEFFSSLIKHPSVKNAYQFYTSTQEPLRARVGGQGLYRRFEHGGIEYIEYRGSYNGVRLIAVNEAYFMPMGVADMFITYFSPANKFASVNTIGEAAYVFSYRDPMDEKILLQSEHNALHLIRRPQAIVRAVAPAVFFAQL